MSRRLWIRVAVVVTVAAAAAAPSIARGDMHAESAPTAAVEAEPAHPRLFVTADDVDDLRARAASSNPIYADGLRVLVRQAIKDMDAGRIPREDGGSNSWELYPTERYAELFAFMYLVSPDVEQREDFGERARDLLMHVMNEAAKGAAEGEPFRDPGFSTRDRSRWSGEAFPLTVDWIYPLLTDVDKSTIRTVFLRWINENQKAAVTSHNHPTPAGVTNDPRLVDDPVKVRWAANNYYAAHMRNIGLMAMALDPADDTDDGDLAKALESATGAWLYVTDHLLRTDLRGGLPSEGLQYGPQTLSFISQFLLALETAGQDDPALWGPQVVFDQNQFWRDVVPAYMHTLSPRPRTVDGFWRGPVYQPAWFGSAQEAWMPDMISLMGPLALHAERTGDHLAAAQIRWIQTHTAPGGANELLGRVSEPLGEAALDSIFYFLTFAPGAASADPRPSLPLSMTSPGLGRTSARTGWDKAATLFGHTLGWSTTDHQSANGNHIELYRSGEWLLKQRAGYDLDYLASDNHNTLAIENDPPRHNSAGDYRRMLSERGSQWLQGLGGDGAVVARSLSEDFVFVSGDSTAMYNSSYERSTDVTHASRSVIWLKPDVIVTYDRAVTRTAGRFKRFWLNVPEKPTVCGQTAAVRTDQGQQLQVDTLLPASARPLGLVAKNEPSGEPAAGEPMSGKLLVQAPGDPKSARFLHVLQAGDGGEALLPTRRLVSRAGSRYAGAVVGRQAVLFPVNLGAHIGRVTYVLPSSVTEQFITGLEPGADYSVTAVQKGRSRLITIRSGGPHFADGGGVLQHELPVGGRVAPKPRLCGRALRSGEVRLRANCGDRACKVRMKAATVRVRGSVVGALKRPRAHELRAGVTRTIRATAGRRIRRILKRATDASALVRVEFDYGARSVNRRLLLTIGRPR